MQNINLEQSHQILHPILPNEFPCDIVSILNGPRKECRERKVVGLKVKGSRFIISDGDAHNHRFRPQSRHFDNKLKGGLRIGVTEFSVGGSVLCPESLEDLDLVEFESASVSFKGWEAEEPA